MKVIFNESYFQRFNRLVLPLVIVWSLVSAGGVFLSNVGTEGLVYRFEPFFEIFHFGDKFAIAENFAGAIHSKLVTTKTLVSYPHRIKAIYRSQSGSFTSINDGKETVIVPIRGKYKDAYHLIGLSDSVAIFQGYGKTFRLRLGHDDMLSRQEVITRSISDPLQEGIHEKEWHSIAYNTVINQIGDLQNITKSIDISQSMNGSKFMGYRINSIASNSLFSQLGLLQGDVIQSVNNQKLESFGDVLTVYAKIAHLRSIRMTVLRNNLQKDIVYEITR
ncbi:MAG: hypothetical protein WC680_02390 [Sulfuricurvum sp.]|jgi:type II secretion system protein C